MDNFPEKEDHAALLEREYRQWDTAHTRMKDIPPPDGRDYLTHASTLFSFLEGVSALHPVAKAVILSFGTIVMFEQARRENDARVTAVFLAQTDMMRVLLDIDQVVNRRSQGDVLRTVSALGVILSQIQQKIRACGNSIDTYYKESRLVKFWKAQDWKNRMLEYITGFNNYRIQLQQTLSIQVASGVNDLVSKMDFVLSRLFAPKHDWEKELDVKTRRLGSPNSWIQDSKTVQSLISATKDPTQAMPAPDDSSTGGLGDLIMGVQVEQIQQELKLSLDALCEKNMDRFELKLNFLSQQIQEAMYNSAQLVIRTLSGPHDRVVNEDLRELWKEMNWIFCVDNKHFTSALFEYYMDKFSTGTAKSAVGPNHGEQKVFEGSSQSNAEFEQMQSQTIPKFSSRSRFGTINHPDSWTLECVALHAERIATAIDGDRSGFIRISEVNTFTEQIPRGWNLPQWCAYSATGWAYEARIYRKRIHRLLLKVTEMQATVLSSNRGNVFLSELMIFSEICYAFWSEPKGQAKLNTSPQLRHLVKEKIVAQDLALRERLASLNWTVEDVSTVQLLFGDKSLETYILQFCTVMLEYYLEVGHACRTVTLDFKEWERLWGPFRTMREISIKRVTELKESFEEDGRDAEDINAFHGGLWSMFSPNRDFELEDLNVSNSDGYTAEDVADYLSDISVLNDFPHPSPAIEFKPYLQYPPWEEFIKTMNESDIPSVIPHTWNPLEDQYLYSSLPSRSQFSVFPVVGWYCDRCSVRPDGECRYKCLDCSEFELCTNCFNLPEEEHSLKQHTFQDFVIYVGLSPMVYQLKLIKWEAKNAIERLQQAASTQQRSTSDLDDNSTLPPETDNDESETPHSVQVGKQLTLACGRCSEPISFHSTFYRCVGHSCEDYFLCDTCVHDRNDADGSEHKWWHVLLALHAGIITGNSLVQKAGEKLGEVEVECELSDEKPPHEDIVSAISAKVTSIVEESLQANNVVLEERISRLELKIDNMMNGLKDLLAGKSLGLQSP